MGIPRLAACFISKARWDRQILWSLTNIAFSSRLVRSRTMLYSLRARMDCRASRTYRDSPEIKGDNVTSSATTYSAEKIHGFLIRNQSLWILLHEGHSSYPAGALWKSDGRVGSEGLQQSNQCYTDTQQSTQTVWCILTSDRSGRECSNITGNLVDIPAICS